MKTKIVLASFVAALSGLTLFASPAKAGTDFRSNVNLGLPRPPVVVSGRGHDAPAYGYNNRGGEVCNEPVAVAPRGYWKDVTVKTWVPARWVVSHDRRGREIRSLAPGYFTYRTDRVWVAYNNHDRNYGGGYSYGYGNR